MNGFCVICGCEIDRHHDVEYIEEGKRTKAVLKTLLTRQSAVPSELQPIEQIVVAVDVEQFFTVAEST